MRIKEPKKRKNPKLTDEERHKRFVETAKKAEASESIEDFDEAFLKLMPPTRPKKTLPHPH